MKLINWLYRTQAASSANKAVNAAVALGVIWAYMFTYFAMIDHLGVSPYSHYKFDGYFTLEYFVASCLFPPIWEELAFRAAPIQIAKWFGRELILPVVIISSIIFGYGHGYGSFSIFNQGVTGFILSMLYIKNGFDVRYNMLVHMMLNIFGPAIF